MKRGVLAVAGLLVGLTLVILGLGALSSQATGAGQAGQGADETAAEEPWTGAFEPLPLDLSIDGAPLPGGVAAADFRFSKTVMLQSDYDATLSCSGSGETLTVNYGTPVVYCYRIKNIGTTTFLTITMVDDKLGSLGPLAFSPPFVPNASGGFLAYGVPMTRTITNNATMTLQDDQGNTVVRSDSATVNVIIPSVGGYVFLDLNGDGFRQAEEQTGIPDVAVTLSSDAGVVGRKYTLDSGWYQFLDVIPGTYALSIAVPAGYVATSPSLRSITVVAGENPVINFGLQLVPTPTPTATSAPTATPTVTPTPSPTPTPTLTPTPSATPTASPTATATAIVPAPPARVWVREAEDSVVLFWDLVSDATAYAIWRSMMSGGPYEEISQVTGTSYTDRGLENGRTYYYVVQTVRGSVRSVYSAEVAAIPHWQISGLLLNGPAVIEHILRDGQPTQPIAARVRVKFETVKPGPLDGLLMEIGYGPEGTRPGTWDTWQPMTYTRDYPLSDGELKEWEEWAGVVYPDRPGEYRFLVRASATGGRDWLYAGFRSGVRHGGLLKVSSAGATGATGAGVSGPASGTPWVSVDTDNGLTDGVWGEPFYRSACDNGELDDRWEIRQAWVRNDGISIYFRMETCASPALGGSGDLRASGAIDCNLDGDFTGGYETGPQGDRIVNYNPATVPDTIVIVSGTGQPVAFYNDTYGEWPDSTNTEWKADLKDLYPACRGSSERIDLALAVIDVAAASAVDSTPVQPYRIPMDYGDLPDDDGFGDCAAYKTRLKCNGARHGLGSPLRLGAAVDPDGGDQQNTAADADDMAGAIPDDEDGVAPAFGVPWLPGGTGALRAVVSGGNGYLSCWLDWNHDGNFSGSGEQIVPERTVSEGTQMHTFEVPANVTFPNAFNVRCRVYLDPTIAPSPYGPLEFGEVEDHRWAFDAAGRYLSRYHIVWLPTLYK